MNRPWDGPVDESFQGQVRRWMRDTIAYHEDRAAQLARAGMVQTADNYTRQITTLKIGWIEDARRRQP